MNQDYQFSGATQYLALWTGSCDSALGELILIIHVCKQLPRHGENNRHDVQADADPYRHQWCHDENTPYTALWNHPSLVDNCLVNRADEQPTGG